MSTLMLVLVIFVAVLLCVVILIQNSKGGIAAGANTFNQVAGVRGASEIEKITWGLAIALFVLCVVSTVNMTSSRNEVKAEKSEVQEYLNENGVTSTTNAPAAPQSTPAQQPAVTEPAATQPAK